MTLLSVIITAMVSQIRETLYFTMLLSITAGPGAGDSVTFQLNVDPNTMFVSGSVRTTPLALDDTFDLMVPALIITQKSMGLLANDFDDDTSTIQVSMAPVGWNNRQQRKAIVSMPTAPSPIHPISRFSE